jgi:hypothetical protein
MVDSFSSQICPEQTFVPLAARNTGNPKIGFRIYRARHMDDEVFVTVLSYTSAHRVKFGFFLCDLHSY